MAVSQCPSSSAPSTTTPPNNVCGTSDSGAAPNNGDNTCKKVVTIDRPVSEVAAVQPVYYFFLSKDDLFNQLDGLCVTFFPIPDGTETFKAYTFYQYTDGSTKIESYVTKSNGTGANIWSTPIRTFVNYNMGYIGCGAYLRYSCPLYAGRPTDNVPPFFLSFGPGDGPVGNGQGRITDECLRTAQSLASDNGLDLGDYYVLPYKLPVRCMFQQICLADENPLTSRQGKSCKAYGPPPTNNTC